MREQAAIGMTVEGGLDRLTLTDADRDVRDWFEDAMLGFQADNVTKDPDPPPDHFGYADGETLGAMYNESHYLVITPAGRQFYPEIWPDYRQYWQYTPQDFERLETDPTVSKVYINGGFETYTVEGTNSTA